MKTVLLVLLCFVLFIPAYAVLILVFSIVLSLFVWTKKEEKQGRCNSRLYRFAANRLLNIFLFVSGVHIKVSGREKMPACRYLMVCNHVSCFDPLVKWKALDPAGLVFISKRENAKIPFFWKLVQQCGFMTIDRSGVENAMKTLERAANLISSDKASVCVYPEGRRSKDGKLGNFHAFVFRIAQMAGCPVVVCKVLNTSEVKHNFPFRRTFVTVKVADVISKEQVQSLKPADLALLSHNIIEEN